MYLKSKLRCVIFGHRMFLNKTVFGVLDEKKCSECGLKRLELNDEAIATHQKGRHRL